MENFFSVWRDKLWVWFSEHARKSHALWWLGAISYTDAIFFPVAPEIFLVALTLAHRERSRTYLAVAAISSALGAASAYFLASFLFHQFGEPILAFYGLQKAFGSARHLIAGHVFWTLAAASFTPIPDKVFIYAAGFLGAHFVPFFLGYVLGRTARMALFVYLTEVYGQEALTLIKRYFFWFTILVVVLGIIYGMVHWHLVPGL